MLGLQSRLADEPTRAVLYDSISALEAMRWAGTTPHTTIAEIGEAQLKAMVEFSNGIETLGELITRAPIAPSPWWDRLLGRTPPPPPTAQLYKMLGPEDLEELAGR